MITVITSLLIDLCTKVGHSTNRVINQKCHNTAIVRSLLWYALNGSIAVVVVVRTMVSVRVHRWNPITDSGTYDIILDALNSWWVKMRAAVMIMIMITVMIIGDADGNNGSSNKSNSRHISRSNSAKDDGNGNDNNSSRYNSRFYNIYCNHCKIIYDIDLCRCYW